MTSKCIADYLPEPERMAYDKLNSSELWSTRIDYLSRMITGSASLAALRRFVIACHPGPTDRESKGCPVGMAHWVGTNHGRSIPDAKLANSC
jgi:hypothetical protein